MPPRGRQRRLRRSRPAAPQRRPHRPAEMPREIVRLVETTLQHPPRMQRNRDDRVGLVEPVRVGADDERRERRGQCAALIVFECVNDRAERPVVPAGAAGHDEPRRVPAASRAERAGRSPGRQHVTTALAPGRGERRHGSPAGRADRALEWALELTGARRARRRQEQPDGGVCGDVHDRKSGSNAPGPCKRSASAVRRPIGQTAVGVARIATGRQ